MSTVPVLLLRHEQHGRGETRCWSGCARRRGVVVRGPHLALAVTRAPRRPAPPRRRRRRAPRAAARPPVVLASTAASPHPRPPLVAPPRHLRRWTTARAAARRPGRAAKPVPARQSGRNHEVAPPQRPLAPQRCRYGPRGLVRHRWSHAAASPVLWSAAQESRVTK